MILLYTLTQAFLYSFFSRLNSDLDAAKQSFQDGCSTIAAAITEMGVATADNASPETMASNIKKINRFTLPYFSFEVISGNQMCILDVAAFKKVSFYKSNTASLRVSIKNNKNELGSYTHTSSEAGDYSFDVAAYKYFAVDYGQKPVFENFKLE